MTVAPFIPHPSTSVQRLPVQCQATTLATKDAQVNKTDTVPVLESNRESDLKQTTTVVKGFCKACVKASDRDPSHSRDGGYQGNFAKEAIRKLRLEDERVRRG